MKCCMRKKLSVQVGDISFIEEMYGRFEKDPSSLDPSWRSFFQQVITGVEKPTPLYISENAGDFLVSHLTEQYRTYGHLCASINPLAIQLPEVPKELLLENLGFTVDDLSKMYPTRGLLDKEQAPLQDIIEILKKIYCNKIGFEFKGLNREVVQWIQKELEDQSRKELSFDEKRSLFSMLNKAEVLETFLHVKYVGQKRFSLEGAETLIPMIEALLEKGSKMGMKECIIGMPHRGRLNVLVNILKKSYAKVFHEFEDSETSESFQGGGDVKYHKGFFSTVQMPSGSSMYISVAPNPSHLESVDPVVEGEVRARQVLNHDDEKKETLALLIHGDASIAGQGVVYETMQLDLLSGYSTGGTIHIVVNNQIGFTTLPKDYKSTLYCTDIAKAFGSPVFHVNAEDPEGCIFAILLAIQLRYKFHVDVFIDLNGYRKYGHNETDEPAFTQPIEYQLIKKKKSIREIYHDQLVQEGALEKSMAESLEKEFRAHLQKELEEIKKVNGTLEQSKEEGVFDLNVLFEKVDTSVSKEVLAEVAKKFTTVPEGFHPHKKVENLNKERFEMLTGQIDWGMAEQLAFASLLWEGKHVRLSGQDSRRGTFSHRHCMWVDQVEENKKYFPLCHLKQDQGRFDIFNSPLSEFAVLGFEYGYSLAYQGALVIWEAQFGDFSNGAQIIIDQYLVCAERKWAKPSRLTLFLPHGFEGQGPEHSSGRMERFLQLAGDGNIFVVNPTTPAQFFHLLRRQVLGKVAKPLIVFTPKGLLRHAECVSPLSDFNTGSFQEVLDDPTKPQNVKKLIFCSGRIYYDLVKERKEREAQGIAFIRIEQLYPINIKEVELVLKNYPEIEAVFWVQEEPRNMGAWHYVKSLLQMLIGSKLQLKYIGRKQRASPAVGSHFVHQHEYKRLMDEVFSENRN